MAAGPLLVFGANSTQYDFGASHPLTPRRFGPGIELLRWVGALPGLAPEPATDAILEWLHAAEYVATVREFSDDPHRPSDAGIGPGDNPAFVGMHHAAASVAGGSVRAMEAILAGDADHAYHPGGGLHHAMRTRASGFCIYNDPALAIARARAADLRVLYVDLDVHHGDGVQALHAHDPGVLTVSLHETGRTLFPGTGFVGELGHGEAAGTSVNVPLEPLTGPNAWLAAVRGVVPQLAAAFGPDVVVSQHGADSHVWDPLAHLAVTTSAMSAAAQLVDAVSHGTARGRWLATGGGGYCAYRVVPRAWAFTWLAGAHRDAPHHIPESWRSRWADDADRWGDSPLPSYFDDEPGVPALTAGRMAAGERAAATVRVVRALAVPSLIRIAEDEGWWRPEGRVDAAAERGAARAAERAVDSGDAHGGAGLPAATILEPLLAEHVERLALAPRVLAIADPAAGCEALLAALRGGATAIGAVAGERLVGVALSAPLRRGPLASPHDAEAGEGTMPLPVDQLVALGVAPAWRRAGLAERLVRGLVAAADRREVALVALITVAERDQIEPLPVVTRRAIAERLLRAAGLSRLAVPRPIADADPHTILLGRMPPGAAPDLNRRIEDAFAAR